MIKNNLLLIIRTLRKNTGYTLFNLVGLTIGLTACLLIVLYISHERSYDQFHSQKDRLYRINYDVLMGGEQVVSPSVPVFVGPQLKQRFAEIADMTRFSTEWRPRTIRYQDRFFDEPDFAYADPNFFDLFDFKSVEGDLKTALARPNSLVITRSMAEKYFGRENPIGKSLNFNNLKEYEVTAVIEDVPANSHFTFSFLASHYSLQDYATSENNIHWNDPNYTTWLLLQPDTDLAGLAQKIEDWIYPPEENVVERSIHLPIEPINAAHFNTSVSNFADKLAVTDGRYLDIFGVIALLILCIACMNYINLTTAQAAVRAKATGIRKVLGAKWYQLIAQFLGESMVLLLPVFLLSIGLTSVLLPTLNNLLDKRIPFLLLESRFVLGLLMAWVLLSLLAGIYPALVLAKSKPMNTLKGAAGVEKQSGFALRKVLVVVQFAISTALIVGSIVIGWQLRYMQTEYLGFDKDQVVYLRGNAELREKMIPFCAQLRGLSGVEGAAPIWRSPLETVIGNGFSLDPNPKDGSDWHLVGGIGADEHYVSTLGLSLLAGRNFDPTKARGDHPSTEFIVNEAFLKHYNLTAADAIGRQCRMSNIGTIVGVIQDFHTTSLRAEVGPVVLYNEQGAFSSAMFRIGAGQDPRIVLAQVEQAWKSTVPMRPFNPIFLDDQYDKLFRTEQRMGALMSIFTGLAVVVACLGLLGLATFVIHQRTKEIGIRKVLGATVAGITSLLAKDFLKLVLIAIVIASPIAYYFMDQWLADFAYRIELQWWMFAVAGVLAVVIAFLTVGAQSVRAALANPVKSLRNE
jgi:putative ABC transport system permease protein